MPEGKVTIGFGSGSVRRPTEGEWCQNRPADCRPPLPHVGDHILFRSNDWFEPVDAIVLAVDVRQDLNWMNRQLPDPWPMLRLKTSIDGRPAITDTHEARLEGSAGWLPLDWKRWSRPAPGHAVPTFVMREGGD